MRRGALVYVRRLVVGAAAVLPTVCPDTAFAAARDNIRLFPQFLACPVHLGWPIDGAGNPIPTDPPRVYDSLVFTAATSQAAITFSACDDGDIYDGVAGPDTIDLTLDELAIVRKDVYDTNQVAAPASLASCYGGGDEFVVRSIFDGSTFVPFKAEIPFWDTFDGAPLTWSLDTARIGLLSPNGFGASHPSGKRLILAQKFRPQVDDMEAPDDSPLLAQGGFFLDTTDGRSGTQSWKAPEPASVSDAQLTTDNVQYVAAGEQFVFWHRFDTEVTRDGGVLEYTTNGGGTWSDILLGNGAGIPANTGRFLENGYNATLASLVRPAWTGTNGASYQRVRVSLADFVGFSVRFRWRFLTNATVGGGGWSIDDALIAMTATACSTATVQVHSLQPGAEYVIDFKWDGADFSDQKPVLTTTIDTAPLPLGTQTLPVERLRHPSIGAYLFTVYPSERDSAVSQYGYLLEGTCCKWAVTPANDGRMPLYRLFSSGAGEYFFTIYGSERDSAVQLYGYIYEGVAAYCHPFQGPSSPTPWYRLRYGNKHLYTIYASERDDAVIVYGFVYEGISCYLPPP